MVDTDDTRQTTDSGQRHGYGISPHSRAKNDDLEFKKNYNLEVQGQIT